MTSYGTKVTKDPEAFNKPINESSGIITSDSLAAESLRSGGSFGNDASGISDQPSRGTTTNNTDISNATVLDPAPDAEARLATEEWNENAQLNAGRGLGKAAGRGPTWNIPDSSKSSGENYSQGGPVQSTNSSSGPDYPTGGQSGTSQAHTGAQDQSGSTRNADPAPTSMQRNVDVSSMKPHGRNITEGGFDENAPNASFDSDIGDKNDPGRLAEQKFQREDAQAGFDAGSGPRQTKITGDGQFDALGEENV